MRLRGLQALVVLLGLLAGHVATAGNSQPDTKATAEAKFAEACGGTLPRSRDRCEPVTAARRAMWEQVAGLYEAELARDPAAADAPRDAFRAAIAAGHLGDPLREVRDLDQLLSTYGKSSTLETLAKSDRAEYARRLDTIATTYDLVAAAYFDALSFTKAADTWSKSMADVRLSLVARRRAAANAMLTFSSLGERTKLVTTYAALTKLQPTVDELVIADYVVASYDYDRWSAHTADTGNNRASRVAATSALSAFHSTHKGQSVVAKKRALEAAWRVAKMKMAVNDPSYHQWLARTVDAWTVLHTAVPDEAQKWPFADYGAEAEYTLIDEEITKTFVLPTQPCLLWSGGYRAAALSANAFDLKLEHIVKTYRAIEFVPRALARRGSLYDALRTNLDHCTGLGLFTPAQVQRQAAAQQAQQPLPTHNQRDPRDELEPTVPSTVATSHPRRTSSPTLVGAGTPQSMVQLRTQRDREMAVVETVAIRYYVQAVALASAYHAAPEAVFHARYRLAVLSERMSDDAMRVAVATTNDPTDPAGVRYLRYKPGMFAMPGQSARGGGGESIPLAPLP